MKWKLTPGRVGWPAHLTVSAAKALKLHFNEWPWMGRLGGKGQRRHNLVGFVAKIKLERAHSMRLRTP